jgi:hypothetical protein
MTRYLGGLITKDESLVLPANNFEDTSAPGVWTLEEAQALNKQGLWPTAGVSNPSKFIENVFSIDTYTGNGSDDYSIVNGIDLSGEGGLVWIKDRDNNNTNHSLFDTVRGVNKRLISHKTDANATVVNMLDSFNSNGFTLGQDNSSADSNQNNTDYVAWTFRKAPKFFDIVTYTGDNSSSARNIAHSLGQAPGMIIIKRYSDAGYGWYVWHRSLSDGYWLSLNSTDAQTNASGVPLFGNNDQQTSTHFQLQATNANVNLFNASGVSYIAYLFGHDTSSEGMIQCGTFDLAGDGAASINLGFEAQFIIMKDYEASASWYMFDTLRGMSRDNRENLYPNSSSETDITTTENTIYPTETGFEITTSFGNNKYIYMAIRRGLMGTPTTRSDVFALQNYDAMGGTKDFTTNFPVDMIMNPTYNQAGNNDNWAVVDRLRGTSLTRPEWLSTNNNYGRDHPTGTSYGWGFDHANKYTAKDIYNVNQKSLGFAWRRAPGFFDMVHYTGNATNRTISHNLGVAPEMMWVKTTVTVRDWAIYHGDATNYMEFNTDIASTDDQTYWNDTAPTSTEFTVGTANEVNENNYTLIAYLFATLAGISKVGTFSHTNGSSTDVDCGFSSGSSFIIAKRTDSTGDWYSWNSAKGIVSGNDWYLLINSTADEVTNTDYIDPLDSGFQIASGFTTGTYFFYAIAA